MIDDDGWFHTGDIGEFTPDGFLKITDRKKALFKLSTGKYVIPQPIENALTESSLIEQAVVVGTGGEVLARRSSSRASTPSRAWGKGHGVDASQGDAALLKDSRVVGRVHERLVDAAQRGDGPLEPGQALPPRPPSR